MRQIQKRQSSIQIESMEFKVNLAKWWAETLARCLTWFKVKECKNYKFYANQQC